MGTGDQRVQDEASSDGRDREVDGATTQRKPLLLVVGAVAAVAIVGGLLAAFGAFGGDDDADCTTTIEPGADYEGPARNTTGGFDGVAAITVTAVDRKTCTASFDIVWSDGLSGRGEGLTGTLDEQNGTELIGTFVWDDGDYDLRVGATELSDAIAAGTYDITARENGPTVAVGMGTFETARIDQP